MVNTANRLSTAQTRWHEAGLLVTRDAPGTVGQATPASGSTAGAGQGGRGGMLAPAAAGLLRAMTRDRRRGRGGRFHRGHGTGADRPAQAGGGLLEEWRAEVMTRHWTPPDSAPRQWEGHIGEITWGSGCTPLRTGQMDPQAEVSEQLEEQGGME